MTSSWPSRRKWAIFGCLLVALFAGIMLPGRLKSDIEGQMWHVLPWAHLAHFVLFGLIAACPVYGSGRPALARSVALAVLLAVLTESIQHWIPGRHPTFRDGMIDLSGTLIGLFGRRLVGKRIS